MKSFRLVWMAAISSLACVFITFLPFPNRTSAPSTPTEFSYTISGTLHPARQITIPANTRVRVIWLVIPADSEAHDYSYVFGEGPVDFNNYSFVIHFDEPPPPEALMRNNGSYFGVGYIVMTAKHIWHKKLRGHAFNSKDIIGIAANQTVIYVDGDFKMFPSPQWLAKFDQGYNLGQGYNTTDPFDEDRFKPADPNSVQIIIDDIDNIDLIHPMW